MSKERKLVARWSMTAANDLIGAPEWYIYRIKWYRVSKWPLLLKRDYWASRKWDREIESYIANALAEETAKFAKKWREDYLSGLGEEAIDE